MSLAHQYKPPIKPVYDSQVESVGGSGITATLPGAIGLTTYLTRVFITCPNVPNVVAGLCTITGLAAPTPTLNYWLVETVTAGGFVPDKFDEPIPASAPNTSIVVTIPAIANGGRVAVNIFGFQAGGPVALN